MKTDSINRKVLLCLFMTLSVCRLVAGTVFAQPEKLGIVNYTPPKGWAKTLKENVVAYSVIDQASGGFSIITVYVATPGTGSPQSNFAREWNNLAVKNLKAAANPPTDVQQVDGWTAVSGGSEVEWEAGKA